MRQKRSPATGPPAGFAADVRNAARNLVRRVFGRTRRVYATRAGFLKVVPKNAVGVELGVFKGEFSAEILRVAKPRELHLVDAWWTAYGDTYPDWGDYTDFG